MKIQTLQISEIRLDFQPPENLIEYKVLDCAEKMSRGEKLPPIRVRFDSGHYFCEDGFHRLEAARRTGLTEIQAQVLKGTLREMEARYEKFREQLRRSLRGK
jgi:uncharacterized ParB-like nuclease family protein